jgi:hypothetical protein
MEGSCWRHRDSGAGELRRVRLAAGGGLLLVEHCCQRRSSHYRVVLSPDPGAWGEFLAREAGLTGCVKIGINVFFHWFGNT